MPEIKNGCLVHAGQAHDLSQYDEVRIWQDERNGRTIQNCWLSQGGKAVTALETNGHGEASGILELCLPYFRDPKLLLGTYDAPPQLTLVDTGEAHADTDAANPAPAPEALNSTTETVPALDTPAEETETADPAEETASEELLTEPPDADAA